MEIKKIKVGPIQANCYIVSSDGEAIVIDPGDDGWIIRKEIRESGLKVLYIVDTHYHYDHVTANGEVKEETGAEILIHEAEKPYIDFPADRFISEGEIIRFGEAELRVINTPGHTKGSICLIGDGFIFTGDTLFYEAYGRTDIAGGSGEEMIVSLKRLDEVIKPGMRVYPGHGPDFIK